MAGCASSCASRSQASPMLTLRRVKKNGDAPNFQEATLPGVRLSCRPRGCDLLRCPCRCLSLLIHYVAFATVTMWAGFLRVWDCGVLAIVLCVLRGLEPSLLLFLAISSQVRQRPHYYLSDCCPGSTTFSPLLHGSQIAFALLFAPQL